MVHLATLLAYTSSAFFSFFRVWMGELYPQDVRATGVNFTLLLGRLLGGGFSTYLAVSLSFTLPTNLSLVLLTTLISATISATLLGKGRRPVK